MQTSETCGCSVPRLSLHPQVQRIYFLSYLCLPIDLSDFSSVQNPSKSCIPHLLQLEFYGANQTLLFFLIVRPLTISSALLTLIPHPTFMVHAPIKWGPVQFLASNKSKFSSFGSWVHPLAPR